MGKFFRRFLAAWFSFLTERAASNIKTHRETSVSCVSVWLRPGSGLARPILFEYELEDANCSLCFFLIMGMVYPDFFRDHTDLADHGSAGSLPAFVGLSRAGKSTAVQLIPRFWDVTGGAIKIDGHNLREYNPDKLMDAVSFVFQDSFLLDDTIYANIAIRRFGCTGKEVEDAAKAAQIYRNIIWRLRYYLFFNFEAC